MVYGPQGYGLLAQSSALSLLITFTHGAGGAAEAFAMVQPSIAELGHKALGRVRRRVQDRDTVVFAVPDRAASISSCFSRTSPFRLRVVETAAKRARPKRPLRAISGRVTFTDRRSCKIIINGQSSSAFTIWT